MKRRLFFFCANINRFLQSSWCQEQHCSFNASTLPLPVCRMMMSSNGSINIFRVAGHFCGEFTGPGEFPAQRPVTRSFDVFFDLSLNKRLSKQSWGWWFETQSRPLWRHYNVLSHTTYQAKLTLVACNFTRRFPTPSIDQGPLLIWINGNHSIHKQLHPL